MGENRGKDYVVDVPMRPVRRADSVNSLTDAPSVLAWKDVTVITNRGKKTLLKGVSGAILGGFWAVMGPSGSGKSTLLNALACRLDKDVTMTGDIRLNGRHYNNHDLKLMAGYVMQDDLLNTYLTVEETLLYTARLRMSATATPEEQKARTDYVINEMGLDHCRHTVIGNPLSKGISGGERKRLCVSMELLTEPLLLFLDEPTSGLDSVTALSLCRKLKTLATRNVCTVVCTIHQPQSKIYNLFDNLILLKSGNIVYQGDAPAALDFFATCGYPLPPNTNPADHLLDVITPPMNESTYSLVEVEETLRQNFKLPDIDLDKGAEKETKKLREVVPWHRQFYVLLQRSFQEQIRKKWLTATLLIQSIIMAVLIGTVFLQIGDTQYGTTRRQPVLFFCVINQGVFGSLMVINSFPSERLLALRERAAGTYYASAYFIAKMGAETITQLPAPVVFACIVYWLIGLQAVASKFFIFTAFMMLCSVAATSLAMAVSTLCRTTDLAVTVLPMAFEIGRLFGGFFLPPSSLPKYFSWLDALSYVKYTYVAISLNELHDLKLHCLPHELTKAGTCPITSGQVTIDRLGLDAFTIPQCAGILIVYIFVCRFIAYLGLRYIKW